VEGVGVEYVSVPQLPGGWLFSLYGCIYYLCCRRIVRRLLQSNSVDLIHAHAILPDGFAAVLLGREFGLPTVCTLHGSDIRLYPLRSRAIGRATRWALKQLDQLVAVSYDLKQKAQRMGMRDDIRVARSGADPEAFRRMERT
jgi:teichuronic acid biosynthesis glycosyltransferase TuaC